jgi:hypothetical protein
MKNETELKTLKDIEHLRINTGRSIGKTGATDVSVMLLKQEAIKWVKDLDNEDCPACKEQGERSYGWCEDCDTAHVGLHKEDLKEWIMHFFNLTEEDLK